MQGPIETVDGAEKATDRLRGLLREKNFDRFEDIWLEAVEDPQLVSSQLEAFLDVNEALAAAEKSTGRAGTLLELLSPAVSESTSPEAVLRLKKLLVYCFPTKKEYRAAFSECFENMYPLASAERVFYEAAGFSSASDPKAALTRLERLLKFREGAHVFHESGWGIGKVLAVDPFLRQVRVDLEHKKDHRIAANVVDTILEPLPEDSFRVLKLADGEGLQRMRDEDPVRLVTLLLETFGNPSPLKEVKRHLLGVVEPSGWSKWWNRVKAQLRSTGLFRIGDRPPYAVEKLEEAVSYEEELVLDFFRSDWARARQIGRLVARRTGGQLPGAWEKIRERLLETTQAKDRIKAIEAALILERGDGSGTKGIIVKGVLENLSVQDLAATLQKLPSVDDHRRVVENLLSNREDWREVASLLFKGRKNTLREAAMDLFEKNAPELLCSLVTEVVRSPKSAPDALCSILQSYLRSRSGSSDAAGTGEWRAVLGVMGARDLLGLVLDLLDHLPHLAERRGKTAYKEIIGRVEKILVDQNCQVLRKGSEAAEPGELADIYSRLVSNNNLAPHPKGAMLQCLLDLQPDLVQQTETPPWEEDSLYVTEAGLERKKEEFREIMEVKLPKVFKDIGRAADFGDLSENAEYTAALEERDRLTKRATEMKKDLDRVKVITPDMLKADAVAFGSKFRVRNLKTEEEIVYSMLGPWDGSPEDGVLSYLSPLGQVFHGRKEGEEFEAQLPGGSETYKLLKIGSFFDGEPQEA